MKKRLKKYFSLFLSAACVFSSLSIPAKQEVKAADEMITDADLEEKDIAEPPAYGPVPNEAQLYYMKSELSAFCHYGPNTYNNVEWGENYGTRAPADLFQLKQYGLDSLNKKFDAETLVKAVKEAGCSRLMLTLKHHDGLCLWDTNTTTYNISNGAYDGDLFEELSDACTKYNLDMGCYLSPWDIHEDRYGCYGSNTANSKGYTDYNQFYIDSIKELCTATKEDGSYKYGNNNPNRRTDRFVEWWMDGAANASKDQKYNWTGIIEAIRAQNPTCQIFGTGKAVNGQNGEDDKKLAGTGGIYWIGNEDGFASNTTWAKTKTGVDYESIRKPDEKTGINVITGYQDGDVWCVPECDVRMLSGWFWTEGRPDSTAKSKEQLANIYFNTVGHGGVLLLNLSPNKTGTVGEPQLTNFKWLGQAIKESFANDLTKADGVTASASSVYGNAKAYSPMNVLDEKPEDIAPDRENGVEGETKYDETYWAPAHWESGDRATLEIDLGGVKEFDVVSIEEYIQKGQAISSFTVDYKNEEGIWSRFGGGGTISSKRLCRRSAVKGSAVRINILKSDSLPMINNVGVFKAVKEFETNSDGSDDIIVEENLGIPEDAKSISIQDFEREGSWTFENGGASAWAKEGSSVSFTFTGTQAWIFGTQDPGHGYMNVMIDDSLVASVNTKTDKRKMEALLYTTPELEYGEHTVSLTVKGGPVGLSEAKYLDVGKNSLFELDNQEINLLFGNSAIVKIIRKHNLDQPATILYETVSSGAEQGVSYKDVTGELTFLPGETVKTVKIEGINPDNPKSQDGIDFYFQLRRPYGSNVILGADYRAHVFLYHAEADVVLNLCREINPDNYTEETADAYNMALKEVQTYQSVSDVSEEVLASAVAKLITAKNALIVRGDYSEETPFRFPVLQNEGAKTVVTGGLVLDTSELSAEDTIVCKNQVSGVSAITNFANKNKVSLPFYAERPGDYTVAVTYQNGNGKKINYRGTNVGDGGSIDISQAAGTQNFTITVGEAGKGELEFFADQAGCPDITGIAVAYAGQQTEPTSVTGITLNPSSVELLLNQTLMLSPAIEPAYADNQEVRYQSNHPEIADVDENGIITAKTKGNAVITVETVDGGFKDACSVAVVSKEDRDKAIQSLETLLEQYANVTRGDYSLNAWNNFQTIYGQAAEMKEAGFDHVFTDKINEICGKVSTAYQELLKSAATNKPVVLAAPTGVKAVSKPTGEVEITFQKVANAASYEIYRQSVKIATVTGTSYTDAKALAGKTSTYTVVAVASGSLYKNSAASAGASVTLPNSVKKLKVKSVKGGARITFKKAKGAKKYIIYRAAKQDGPYKKVKTLKAKQTSFIDKKAKKGKNFYKVVVQTGKTYSPAVMKKVTIKK